MILFLYTFTSSLFLEVEVHDLGALLPLGGSCASFETEAENMVHHQVMSKHTGMHY